MNKTKLIFIIFLAFSVLHAQTKKDYESSTISQINQLSDYDKNNLSQSFVIDEKTHDVAENGWKGITQGRAIGWGTGANLPKNYSLNIGTQITVYRDPDNPLHSYSSKSDWFFYKPYISK